MNFEIIEEAGLTQTEFAWLTGASRGTVNNWVKGKSNPTNAYHETCKRNLLLLQVAHRMKLLPGDIPSVYKANMDSRMVYISGSLKSAAQYIKQKLTKEPADDT